MGRLAIIVFPGFSKLLDFHDYYWRIYKNIYPAHRFYQARYRGGFPPLKIWTSTGPAHSICEDIFIHVDVTNVHVIAEAAVWLLLLL